MGSLGWIHDQIRCLIFVKLGGTTGEKSNPYMESEAHISISYALVDSKNTKLIWFDP